MTMEEGGVLKAMFVFRMITGFISAISSAVMLITILRSVKKLTTTQNRLLFGLSLSDLIASISLAFVSIPMPKGSSTGWITLGNTTSCEVQAFCFMLGLIAAALYNAGLCLFYFIKIRHQVDNERLRTRIEPFLHGIPIVFALAICCDGLINENFNPGYGTCALTEYPLGCSSQDDIECQRGKEASQSFSFLSAFILTCGVVPIIIISSMTSVYITVLRQEQRMSVYGRGSLATVETRQTDRFGRSFSRVRKVMNRALAYAGAWFLTYMFAIPVLFYSIFNEPPPPSWLLIGLTIFQPLQGFFNFMIYIYPRVVIEQQLDPDISLYNALLQAIKSTGAETARSRLLAQRRGHGVRNRPRRHNSMIVRNMDEVVRERERAGGIIAEVTPPHEPIEHDDV